MTEDKKPEKESQERRYPSGIFGLLARLRDSGVLQRMPASWGKILLAFLSHRNSKGYCWPSQRTIAQEAGVSLSSVERFIKWTKASLGWQVTRKRYNSYYIPFNEKIDTWFPTFKTKEKPSPQHTKVLEPEKPGLSEKEGETVTGDGFDSEKPSIDDGLKPSPQHTEEVPLSSSIKKKDYGTSQSTITPKTSSPREKPKAKKPKKPKIAVGESDWKKAYEARFGKEAAKRLEREAKEAS